MPFAYNIACPPVRKITCHDVTSEMGLSAELGSFGKRMFCVILIFVRSYLINIHENGDKGSKS